MKRKSIGPKLRFEVLSRDRYTCRYCGRTPPEVKLHLDHIYPVSLGGETIKQNLVTACQDCNIGKGNRVRTLTREELLEISQEIDDDIYGGSAALEFALADPNIYPELTV